MEFHLEAPACTLFGIVQRYCNKFGCPEKVEYFLSLPIGELMDHLQEDEELWDCYSQTRINIHFIMPFIMNQVRLQALAVCQQCGKGVKS